MSARPSNPYDSDSDISEYDFEAEVAGRRVLAGHDGPSLKRVADVTEALECMCHVALDGHCYRSDRKSVLTTLIEPLQKAHAAATERSATFVPRAEIENILVKARETTRKEDGFLFTGEDAETFLATRNVQRRTSLWKGCQTWMAWDEGRFETNPRDNSVMLMETQRNSLHAASLCLPVSAWSPDKDLKDTVEDFKDAVEDLKDATKVSECEG